MPRIRGLIVAAGIPSASQTAMVKSLLITRPVNHIPVKGPGPEWFFYAETSGRADKCHLLLPGNSLPHYTYDATGIGIHCLKMQPHCPMPIEDIV